LNKSSTDKKKKIISNSTKKHCLENCIKEFGNENITILGDKLNVETKNMVKNLGVRLIEVNNGTGSKTFRDAIKLAIEENDDDTITYLLEDDFLHKPNSKKILIEGINLFDSYITLYDHPDKYTLNNYNLKSDNCEVFYSQSAHWKLTNSTVMSFACKVKRLKQDIRLLDKYSSGRITQSNNFFTSLRKDNVNVYSSIPGYSTHCETDWLSPLTDWTQL